LGGGKKRSGIRRRAWRVIIVEKSHHFIWSLQGRMVISTRVQQDWSSEWGGGGRGGQSRTLKGREERIARVKGGGLKANIGTKQRNDLSLRDWTYLSGKRERRKKGGPG